LKNTTGRSKVLIVAQLVVAATIFGRCGPMAGVTFVQCGEEWKNSEDFSGTGVSEGNKDTKEVTKNANA
jgi:hypothetical protein